MELAGAEEHPQNLTALEENATNQPLADLSPPASLAGVGGGVRNAVEGVARPLREKALKCSRVPFS